MAQDLPVIVSPCQTLSIPVYEEGTYRTSLMQDYLPDHTGEGVQHIALVAKDIFASVEILRSRGIRFVQPPARYYEQLDERSARAWAGRGALRSRGILVDGAIAASGSHAALPARPLFNAIAAICFSKL